MKRKLSYTTTDKWFIGITISVVAIIILCLYILPKFPARIFNILSVLLALIGILYAVVSARKAAISAQEFTNSQREIWENLSTKPIPSFPENIKEVIIFIDKCKEKDYLLDIYTDVAGYGIFSQNSSWHKYRDKIAELRAIPIHWYYYSDKKIQEMMALQFKPLEKLSAEKLKPIIDKIKDNVHRGEPNCIKRDCQMLKDGKCKNAYPLENTCYVIYHDLQYSYQSIIDTANKLQNIATFDIRDLRKNGANIKTFQLDNELPFFAWIALDRKTKEPVEGIITYPSYKDGTENGFRTSDHHLLETFYNQLQTNVQAQLSETDAENAE